MKREEFLLGASLYLLIIAAGYSGPILKKLGKLPWDRPIGSFVWSFSQTPALSFNPKVPKGILTSATQKTLKPSTLASGYSLPPGATRQKRQEYWEKIASHPAVFGTEPTPKSLPRFGKRKDLKLTPVIPERKVPYGEEPTKG